MIVVTTSKVPLIQLDPTKAILVFAHDANTFDKNKLLINPDPKYVKPLKMKPKNLIKNKELLKFYTTI